MIGLGIPANASRESSAGSGSIATNNAQNQAALLSTWRTKLAGVLAGTSNARLLCVGDSTTVGIGDSTAGTNTYSNSYPTQLSKLLNNSFDANMTPSVRGLAVATANGSVDGRWVLGTNWAASGTFGAGNVCSYKGNGTTGNLVFTPGVLADSYTVYYLRYSGGGTLTTTATGGTPDVRSCAGASAVQSFVVTAASASISNTVSLSVSVQAFILGIEPFLSTAKQIIVGNAGAAGSTAAAWNASPGLGGIDLIKAYAPDLTIIGLGLNDAVASTSAATWQANMQLLISAAKISGDVIICTQPPNTSATIRGFQLQYLASARALALAVANGCVLLDIYDRFGAAFNTPLMNADGTHCNDLGYWDWAKAAFKAVTAV